MTHSSGWSKVASRYHSEFKKSMAKYKDKEKSTSEIQKIFKSAYPNIDERFYAMPTDHCNNHTNKGECDCALKNNAIFEKVR
ncbi:MAG: hypothetical protein AABY84_13170 [Candidatus Firestonebacteria bacterium]